MRTNVELYYIIYQFKIKNGWIFAYQLDAVELFALLFLGDQAGDSFQSPHSDSHHKDSNIKRPPWAWEGRSRGKEGRSCHGGVDG